MANVAREWFIGRCNRSVLLVAFRREVRVREDAVHQRLGQAEALPAGREAVLQLGAGAEPVARRALCAAVDGGRGPGVRLVARCGRRWRRRRGCAGREPAAADGPRHVPFSTHQSDLEALEEEAVAQERRPYVFLFFFLLLFQLFSVKCTILLMDSFSSLTALCIVNLRVVVCQSSLSSSILQDSRVSAYTECILQYSELRVSHDYFTFVALAPSAIV